MLTDEIRYRILKLLEERPSASQREIARELGISLGRVNFCVQALIEKGSVKVSNFRSSANKRAYFYLLTARGIEDKAKVTVRFLRRKLEEYEALKREVEELQHEARRVDEQARRQAREGVLAQSVAKPVSGRVGLKR